MLFHDRHEAAGLLADRLAPYRGTRPLVVGLLRGGAVMAREIADALEGELDVLLVRELHAPATGAVVETGAAVLLRPCPLAELDSALDALRRERALYPPRRPPAGRVTIAVDDGAAPAAAALRALKKENPSRLVLATAVARAGDLEAARGLAEDVVCLSVPAYFGSASRYFMEFHDVAEAEVVDALAP
jgi:predicted phosphoribosyltransferase